MDPIDNKWLNALRRFMGNGWGPVPYYRALDGSVDADKTVEAAFGLYNIKPKGEPSGKE